MKYQKILVSHIGGTETIQLIEEQFQKPKGDQVAVKILACGVAFADILIRYGDYPGVPKPPLTPGYDLIGEVQSVGPLVKSIKPGDQVAALTVFGSYSQYINLPENWLVKIPNDLNPIKSAALTLNYVTAYQMMVRMAKCARGQRVLIHGASGGVGTALMQLGQLYSLEMIGTASASKHAMLEKYGVTPIDYQTQNFEQILKDHPVDLIFENIGGENLTKSLAVLNKGGKMIVYGARTSLKLEKRFQKGLLMQSILKSFLYNLLPNGKKVQFYAINARKNPEQFRQDLTHIFQQFAQGNLDPEIGAVYPLQEAAAANRLMEMRQHSGKIILVCNT